MKTMTIAASLVVLGAALLTAGAAHATVVAGTGTFADNGPAGNGLIFSGVTDNAALSDLSLSLNTPVTLTDFLTISSDDTNNALFGSAGATDHIDEAFTFTLPSGGSGSVNGSGSETTTSFFGVIDGASGSVTWTNPGVVDFSDGAVLDISLSSASFDVSGKHPDQTVDVNATFDLIQNPMGGTPVPEPASLALLGVGLLGIGMIRRRRSAV